VDSSDAVVIAKAQEVEAILLSLNGDFADIVTYPPKNYKGICRASDAQPFGNSSSPVYETDAYLKLQPTMEHYRGKLLVVEVDRIRIQE
jgi:phage repressor protein C with HTH and peptisase S24 domain